MFSKNKIIFDYQNFDSLSDFIEKTRQSLFYQQLKNRDVLVSNDLQSLFGDGNAHGVIEANAKRLDKNRHQELMIRLDNGRILQGLSFGKDYQMDGESIKAKSKDFDVEQLMPLIANKISNFPRPVDVINNAFDYKIVNKVSSRYTEMALLNHHDGDIELLGKMGSSALIKFLAEAPSIGHREIIMLASQEILEVSDDVMAKVPDYPSDVLSNINNIRFYLKDLLELKDFNVGIKEIPEEMLDEYHAIVIPSQLGFLIMTQELELSAPADKDDGLFFTDAISDECLRKIDSNAKLMSVSDLLQVQSELNTLINNSMVM